LRNVASRLISWIARFKFKSKDNRPQELCYLNNSKFQGAIPANHHYWARMLGNTQIIILQEVFIFKLGYNSDWRCLTL